MKTLYYYCCVSVMVLLGFVFAAHWEFQTKHPLYSNAGHLTRWDGLAGRKRKISTEYGIEHPRVDGSIPSQATKQERSSSQGGSGFFIVSRPESALTCKAIATHPRLQMFQAGML